MADRAKLFEEVQEPDLSRFTPRASPSLLRNRAGEGRICCSWLSRTAMQWAAAVVRR